MVQETQVEPEKIKPKAPPRERILKAADMLFERHGIRGVGVEAIAEAAGTNKMTLYRHFSSKDDLVAEWLKTIVCTWTDQWDALESLPDSMDPRVKIDRFVEEFGNAFAGFAVRGCPLMNSLAELPEKDHPARVVLDEHKALSRKRTEKFFRKIGVSAPARAAEEVQLLMDGAKAGVQDLGVERSRQRFVEMARRLLKDRLPA